MLVKYTFFLLFLVVLFVETFLGNYAGMQFPVYAYFYGISQFGICGINECHADTFARRDRAITGRYKTYDLSVGLHLIAMAWKCPAGKLDNDNLLTDAFCFLLQYGLFANEFRFVCFYEYAKACHDR